MVGLILLHLYYVLPLNAAQPESINGPSLANGHVPGYQIVKVLPHDPAAFTQGLLYENKKLYESTGRYGHSQLRIVTPANAHSIQTHRLAARYFAEGLALVNNQLYQLTWRSGIGFIYDAETLQLKGQFEYKGQGWGLTDDGESLIMSNGSDRLSWHAPESFKVIRSVRVTYNNQPVTHLNELEYIEGEIWANIWMSRWIVRINPETGQVNGWIDCSGLDPGNSKADVLNGIAYDKATGNIFLTGKYWSHIYVMQAVSSPKKPKCKCDIRNPPACKTNG